jgi:cyclic beta-1,2-glucan synthetase
MREETINSYTKIFSDLGSSTDLSGEEYPSDDLFSIERLEEYAFKLASQLNYTSSNKKGQSFRPELKRIEERLDSAYQSLVQALAQKQTVSPAAEWFIDNFHIIETQLREIKHGLPDDYYYGLPQLSQ